MNHKVLRRAINICWVILVICFVVKAFGGNWFAANMTSTYLEEHLLLTTLLSFIVQFIMFNLYYLAICEVKNFKWWVHLSLFVYLAISSVLKIFILPSNLHLIVDLFSDFVVPIFLLASTEMTFKAVTRERYFRTVLAFCLLSGFQLISTMVKNITVNATIVNLLTQLLFGIDVTIMLALYWLYSLLNKEVKEMSIFFQLLMGKGEEELTAMLSEVNEKLEKDPENSKLLEEKAEIEKALSGK